MYKKKVDIFLETGIGECKHHGSHADWRYQSSKRSEKNGKVYKFRSIYCRFCSRENTKKQTEKNPNLADDYRYSFQGSLIRILAQARVRAKKRKQAYELDIEWLKKKLEIQDYKCAYSGIKFDFSKPEKYDRNRKYLPSVDQRIAGLGYTKENCEVVCSIVNMMKNELIFDDFVHLCGKIYLRNGYL